LVGTGKADFSILDAKCGQALQQADGIRNRDFEIRLLHSVAKARFKQLDFSSFGFLHLCLFPTDDGSFKVSAMGAMN
jgi:hypothetical protein